MKKYCLAVVLIMHTDVSPFIKVYYEDLFSKELIPTEYTAYKLMKKWYPNKNYLAVPWSVILNSHLVLGKDCFNFLDAIQPLKNGITVCQHDRYDRIIPLLQRVGVNKLFAPHAKHNERYGNLEVLPFPHFPINGTDPAKKKTILYSFVGTTKTHWTRSKIASLEKYSDVILIDRSYWHWSRQTWNKNCNTLEQQKEECKEYKTILAHSRFSLCPRGFGPSTIRFWESLQAGAIPVLIGDDMVLPSGFKWEDAVVKIDLEDIDKIDAILRSISFEQEEHMRRNCLHIFGAFQGKGFIRLLVND